MKHIMLPKVGNGLNRTMLIKLIIDVTMTFLMLAAMAYQITGILIHEVVGVVLLVLFIVHNILNRWWYKTILKGNFNFRRMLSITVNLLFLVSMITVMISSVPISREVIPFFPINNDMVFMQIHVMTSYWGFILMAIHIGMSWGTIINAMRKMTGITDPSRIRTVSLRTLAVLIVVYGVQTSFERNLGSKLIYTTVDRGNAHEKLYASPETIEAVQNGEPIPQGTVLTLEIYRDEVLSDIFVMEKRPDWGDQPTEEQNGDWRFQAYNADQSLNTTRDVASCISCHASQERDDFLYTLDEMKTFQLEDFTGAAVEDYANPLEEEWKINALADYLVSVTNVEEKT